MANAGMRGRPIVPLVLSAAGTIVFGKAGSSITGLPARCLSGAASFCDVQTAYRVSLWLLNSACTNTQLASGVVDF